MHRALGLSTAAVGAVMGGALCIAGCLAAFLASPDSMSGTLSHQEGHTKNVSRHRPLSLQGKTAPAESPIVVTQDQNGSSAVPMEQVCSAGPLPSVIINGAPALPMPLSPIHTLWRAEEGRPRWHTEGSVPQGQLSFMILWADTNAGLPTTILSDR